MLIPGKIPNKEPLIRVGIILPEDQIDQTIEAFELSLRDLKSEGLL